MKRDNAKLGREFSTHVRVYSQRGFGRNVSPSSMILITQFGASLIRYEVVCMLTIFLPTDGVLNSSQLEAEYVQYFGSK